MKDKVNMNYMYKYWYRYVFEIEKLGFFFFDFYCLVLGKFGVKKYISNIFCYLLYIFNWDDERVYSIFYYLIILGRRLRLKINWFDNDKNGVYFEVDMNYRIVIFVNNF